MSVPATKHFRSAQEIEADFAEIKASDLPTAGALDKFERLWEEANAAAGELLPEQCGMPYLALLKQLQEVFDYHKRGFHLARVNGHRWGPRW